VAGATVAVLVVVAIVAALAPHHHRGPSRAQRSARDAARAFRIRMRSAFTGLVGDLPQLVEDVDALDKGTMAPDAFTATHADEVAVAARTRDAVATTRGLPHDPRPRALYWRSAQLYVEATQTFVDASRVDPPLRHQVILAGKRIRVLGDRIFDRGAHIIEAAARDAVNPDLQVALPREVPDWVNEGLAAGPPVGTVVDNHVAIDEADPHPPTQHASAWERRTRASVALVTRTVARLPATTTVGDLTGAAETIDGAVAAIVLGAEPAGRHEAAMTIELALRTEEEAARGFALAAALPASVADIAHRRADDLAVIAAAVWSIGADGLGRPDGFDPPSTRFAGAGLDVEAAVQ